QAVLCEDPATYIRKASWQETMRVSREAMTAEYAGRLTRSGLTPGPWQVRGPFTSETPFTTAFSPEPAIRPKKETQSDRAQWKEEPGWTDGVIVFFEPAPQSAHFVRRSITAKRDTQAAVYLGSDDGIKVWVNESLVFEHNIDRAAARNQERVVLPLRRGANTLLLKITNGNGPTGFVFSFAPDDPDAIWSLLERDFKTPDDRQQMAWEREDDIWSASWASDDYTPLTKRYFDAYARIAQYASPGDVSEPFGYHSEAALVRAQRSYTTIRLLEQSMATRETADLVREITPSPSPVPRINGPKVLGVRPGSPVSYTIPVTGGRPLTFAVDRLPSGLTLDAERGRITGALEQRGEFVVTLRARNELGEASKKFTFIVGDRIALTPPLGWNSWNCFGHDVDDAKIRAAAEAMVSSGLADHGWSYINIDDCWMVRPDTQDSLIGGVPRDASGAIRSNARFPDMGALSSFVHGKGLKLGIYSSPGPLTCGGYTGSYGFELQDARQFAAWGVDYLKYDWCSYGGIAKDQSRAELQKPYVTMRSALDRVKRDIVYSLCQYGMGNVWEWGAGVGGNSWRTTGDITDTWQSMSGIGFSQAGLEKFAGPGAWNDPDMLVVGMVGWGPQLRPTRLKPFEQITHITLWSLLASPLLIGCDLTRLDEFTVKLLTNDEVLEVNQDPLGRQARRAAQDSTLEVWAKELEDGSLAVGLFNRGEAGAKVTARWEDLGITGRRAVRDLWRQKDLGTFTGELTATVARHGVVFVKLTATE
ncbi:MAG: agaA, partial [Bacteroidetes bacterium]|nr:agaA [Bacteroidota bacterium]